MPNRTAVVCASGSFKGVFAHGVLSALEVAGFRADAYAAASSTVMPTAFAACGMSREAGVRYWLRGLDLINTPGNGMSEVVLGGIKEYSQAVCDVLFRVATPPLYVAVSAVTNPEAAAETQGNRARRLGRSILLAAARGDRSWAEQNLAFRLFSTMEGAEFSITPQNYGEVAYASTRMMHAWEVPAWISGQPYIDASYTCSCPALAMAERGYGRVIAVANEPGDLYTDLFKTNRIPDSWQGSRIYIVRPETDPKEMGVDFTRGTPEGLHKVYNHGREQGAKLLTILKTKE